MKVKTDKNGKVIIPRGYRRLRVGTLLREGDLVDFVKEDWTKIDDIGTVGTMALFGLTYIRKIKKT